MMIRGGTGRAYQSAGKSLRDRNRLVLDKVRAGAGAAGVVAVLVETISSSRGVISVFGASFAHVLGAHAFVASTAGIAAALAALLVHAPRN